MKYLILIAVLLAGCTTQPTIKPGTYTSCIAIAVGCSVLDSPTPDNTPDKKVPRSECTRCNGTGRITHGDGHTSECPNCYVELPTLVPIPTLMPTLIPERKIPDTIEIEVENTMVHPSQSYSTPQRRGLFRVRSRGRSRGQ